MTINFSASEASTQATGAPEATFNNRKLASACCSAVIALSAGMTSTCLSAETLEEIVVQATLQPGTDPRTSLTVFNAAFVQDRSAQHLEDLLSAAPNVNAASGASRSRFFQIRGIGERSQFVEPVNASVAMLLDGIDVTGLGALATTWDLQQIEVLRGPQGTLFGANALAGLINLSSTPPDTQRGVRLDVGFENYNGSRLGTALGGQLNAHWFGRVAIQHYRSDGYQSNTWLGRDDTNNRDELTARIAFSWVTEQQRIDIGLTRIDVDNGYDAFSLDNTRQTLSDHPGRDTAISNAGRLRWQYSGVVDLTAQLSHAATDSEYSYDEDWSYVGIAPALEYSSFDQYLRDRTMTSLEFRANTDIERGSGVIGLYLRQEDESLNRYYTYLDRPFSSQLEIETAAVFGQAEVILTEHWSSYLGLRVERRATDYKDSAAVAETFRDTLWSGRAGLSWQPDNQHSFYLGISRGVRAGGINADLLASLPAFDTATQSQLGPLGVFDDESLVNLEAGWHWESASAALRSALTVFTMRRRDQQAKGSLTLPRADGSTAFIDYSNNAARGDNLGLEGQLAWQLTSTLRMNASLGLLDATFDTYVTPLGDDLSGRTVPQAPKTMAQWSANWQATEQLRVGLELTYMDSFYFSDRHDTRSSARTLLNGHISWQKGPWRAQIWGRNLADEDYFVRGFGSFGNDPRKGYITEPYYQFGEPRIVGITVGYEL